MKLKFDDIKKLHQKKYRDLHQHFLVEGEHLVLELEKAAKTNSALANSEVYVTESHQDFYTSLTKHLISQKAMAQLSGTKSPQGIIAVTPIAARQSEANSLEKAIYLYEIQDPGNLGTILRTLAWFGGFRCLLSPNSVDPFNPKVVRASMGAIFHTPFELGVELSELPNRYKSIATLDMQGGKLTSNEFKQSQCLIFGNEARGVPQDATKAINAKPYTIEGTGAIESLNLASTVNMCAYEMAREGK